MKNFVKKTKYILITVLFFSAFSMAFGQKPGDYTVLAPLPGIGEDGPTNFEKYVPAAFRLTIAIAAGMAFVAITIGGITYATTDAVFQKTEGRKMVENAIWGLLLVIGAYAILYTINPQTLRFDLSIKTPKITTPPPTAIVAKGTESGVKPPGTGGVGCEGDCRYSYTNTLGVVVSYRDCSDCQKASSFGLKIKTLSINGTEAQMNTELGNKLKGIRDSSGAPPFEVTETWPPTVRHSAQGQYDGTSVDVGLQDKNPSTVKNFIEKAEKQGLRVVYEVTNPQDEFKYTQAGIKACRGDKPSSCVMTVPYASGQHFSVYKR